MTGGERKRKWRENPEHRARENEAHRARRDKPNARLAESMRDTLRHSRNQLARSIERAKTLY